MNCVEIVIYEVKADKEQQFLNVYGWIRKEMGALSGFVSAETLQSLDQGHTYADLWIWDSMDHAKEAHAAFGSLPHAGEFMDAVERVLHSGHYVPFL